MDGEGDRGARHGVARASRASHIKDVAQPARVALTGRTASPGLFEVIEVLGREEALARLEKGKKTAEGTQVP